MLGLGVLEFEEGGPGLGGPKVRGGGPGVRGARVGRGGPRWVLGLGVPELGIWGVLG